MTELQAPPAPPEPVPCASCSRLTSDRFCAACGEPRLDPGRYSLRHFAKEAVEAVTDADGRLLGSLRALLLRPGELTEAYFRGPRTRYLRPLQLFLLCNVVFFFAQSQLGWQSLDTPLAVHVHHTLHERIAHEWVFGHPHVASAHPEPGAARFREIRGRFDAAASRHARTMVVLMVPLLALVLAALLALQRRFLVEHLVFATHFYAFFLLAIPILLAVLALASRLGAGWLATDGPVSVVLLATCFLYLSRAVRRFYRVSPAGALWRGAALSAGFVAVLFAYRMILFFTAYAAAVG